jgi:AcrR family transcriptional regulator
MPRRYTLGKRADVKADTRARIIAAAVDIYRDRGMAAASNLAIARAADVAPATIRNHFADPSQLASAVFDEVLVELRPPGQEIFDGSEGIANRIRLLATELASFYERSEPWWRAYQREPALIEAWSSGVDRYYRDIDDLMRAALGPLAADERALAVVAAVIGPPTFFALRARGLSSDEAVDLGAELAVPWLEARMAEMRTTGRSVGTDADH